VIKFNTKTQIKAEKRRKKLLFITYIIYVKSKFYSINVYKKRWE